MVATTTLKIYAKLLKYLKIWTFWALLFYHKLFWHEDCGEVACKEIMKNEMFQILIIIIVIILLLSVYYFYSLDQMK